MVDRDECNTPRPPYTTGRAIQGGALATRKQDFNAHISGEAFRHCADQINMNPPLDITPTALDVQTTLEQLSLSSGLNGIVVSIGQVGKKLGDYNVGTGEYPTLNDALTAAFSDPQVSTTGGVIFIKAGVYRITSTITIPFGFQLWGEKNGTFIDAQMNEDAIIDVTASDNTGQVAQRLFANQGIHEDENITVLKDLVIGDNLYNAVGNFQCGSVIKARGAGVVMIDGCSIIGQLRDSGITSYGVDFDGSSFNPGPNFLSITNSFIQALRSIVFLSTNTTRQNWLKVENSNLVSFSDTAILTFPCFANIHNNSIQLISDLTTVINGDSNLYTAIRVIGLDPIIGSRMSITGNIGGVVDTQLRLVGRGQGRLFRNTISSVFPLILENNSWGQGRFASSTNYGTPVNYYYD